MPDLRAQTDTQELLPEKNLNYGSRARVRVGLFVNV